MLKPPALKIVSHREIEEAVEKAMAGVTDLDLALVLETSSIYCDRCGECCRRCDPIVLSPEDLNALGFLLPTSTLQHYVSFKDGVYYFKHTKPCAFLRGNNCRIYDFRPLVCRQFPIIVRDDGVITLGWFDYCTFPLNVVTWKAIGGITHWILERTDPQLAREMEKYGVALSTVMGSMPTQESHILEAVNWVRFVCAQLEKGGKLEENR